MPKAYLAETVGDGASRKKYRVRLFRRNNGNKQYMGKATIRCHADELGIMMAAFEEVGWLATVWGKPDTIKAVAQISDMKEKPCVPEAI